MKHPEPPVSPPDREPNLQADRDDYKYQTPQARLEVVREAIDMLVEIVSSLRWMDRSDPEVEDNFSGAIPMLIEIEGQLEEYLRNKIEPWL